MESIFRIFQDGFLDCLWFLTSKCQIKKGAGRPGTLDRKQPQLFLCFDCFLLSWHDSDCTKYSCHTVLEENSWEADLRNKVWVKKLRKSWAKTTVLRADISYELGQLWQVVLKPSGCLAQLRCKAHPLMIAINLCLCPSLWPFALTALCWVFSSWNMLMLPLKITWKDFKKQNFLE